MGKTDPKYADIYGKSAPDLWHAAINSRGRFFSAETPETLQYSFEKLLSLIEAATPTAAALATNSTRTSGSSGQSTRIFQARFDTRYWNGQLYALEVNAVSGSVSGPVWNAATVLPAANARSIYIRKGNASEHLTWSNLTNEQKGHLNQSDNLGSQRLDWLRGDHRLEQRYTGGQFRNRIAFERGYDGQARQDRSEWVLGDIISSDPVYLGADNQHYDQLAAGSGGKSSYAAYVNYKKTRAPMLYVGANDGMLHAFRVSDGVEQFAVIPNAVFPNLHLLTNPDYSHRYFVDGSPGAGDAYLNNSLSDSSGWNSVVVSGLRAGGKSVFAVDATNPADDLPARFMWEFNADESDNDMGYSYSQPQVVRLNDGNWAAVFGNGYNSSKGGVHLYVVRLSDGVLLKKITALATNSDNGLSTPTLVDSDGDRIVDMAYAGDLKGNLWKFDLKSGSSSNWSVSKLFTAVDSSGNTQPITVQPTALKGDGGIWVFVGTGRLLAKEDIGASAMSAKQSFYGLWDNNQPIAGRGVLVSQTITNTTSKNGMSLRVTSDNEVNLTSKRGWYMDLSDSGERVIAEATTVIDNVSSTDNRIIFTTAIPSADPCNAQGSSWLMELSFTGRRPSKPVFDLNQDYQFKTGDDTVLDGVIPTGMGSTVGLMDSVTWLDRDAKVGFKLVPGTRGKVQTITNRGRGVAGRPQRINWQQLL
jgi:type IV pilus assembly protein PilY1